MKGSKMKEKLNQIRAEALAAISDENADLEQIRIKYLGKKGELTSVLRGMGALTPEERPIVGQIANEVRTEIEEALSSATSLLKEKALEKKLIEEKIERNLLITVIHQFNALLIMQIFCLNNLSF